MEYLSLDGEWRLTSGHRHEPEAAELPPDGIVAHVPGCVHTDLLGAGYIADPYFADQEERQYWVGRTDWVYTRTFTAPAEFLDADAVEIVCEGLDTLAHISINGSVVADTNNAFRTYRFDVRRFLRAGENTVTVVFDAATAAAHEAQNRRFLWHTGIGSHRISGGNHLRKSQCNFGWDWGPRCVTAGIWRPIRLRSYSGGALSDVSVRRLELTDNAAELHVSARAIVVGANRPAAMRIQVQFNGADVAVGSAAFAPDPDSRGNRTSATVVAGVGLHVAEPKLWWPNGMGEQPLYTVNCELLDDSGQVLDCWSRRIGLRSLRLVREEDEWGEQFAFEVNGVPLFAKGANWIPADTFVTRTPTTRYRQLLSSAADANMNMLRVWGGGIYEDDHFYDVCDELGLLVWQDFMFACSAYPADNPDFLENVRAEAVDAVVRLRSHPSLALWCGNNELEQIHGCIGNESEAEASGAMSWESYKRLFDDVLPGIVAEYDPERPYWPSSPHTPGEKRADANDPRSGDAHLWMVWHGRQPFESYRECEHRFNSEFGFQSFPEPRAVERFTHASDRNITSRIMEHHQRSAIGNDAIVQYMLEWFRLPSNPEMVLWTSQILQGLAVTYAVDHWRRSAPRGMGTLYWQLNDCWPAPSWSSIDWEGRLKALHYMAKRFYAPLLVSAVEDPARGTVRLFVTSDLAESTETRLEWRLWTTAGELVSLGIEDVDTKVRGSVEVLTLDFSEQIAQLGAHTLLFFAELYRDNQLVNDTYCSFVRPKHLDLENPMLTVEPAVPAPTGDSKDAVVRIAAEKPALWVWPAVSGADAAYSDRFFHVEPDRPKLVSIGTRGGERKLLQFDDLTVYSLWSTYS